jgi:hypothetical protein
LDYDFGKCRIAFQNIENTEHVFIVFQGHDAQANMLYRSLLAANINIVLNTLLFGSQMYNIDTNRHVCITVQKYILQLVSEYIIISLFIHSEFKHKVLTRVYYNIY